MPPPSVVPDRAAKRPRLSSRTSEAKAVDTGGSEANPDNGGVLLADGRAQRALRNLEENIQKFKAELAGIKVDDDPPASDPPSQTKFRQDCSDRATKAKAVARQAREYLKRMEKSSNRDSFGDRMAELGEVEFAATSVQALLGIFSCVNTAPVAVVKAFEDLQKYTHLLQARKLGTCFQLKYAFAQASQNCLYREYNKFCLGFLTGADLMASLLQDMGREKLKAFVVAEVESRGCWL